MFVRAFNVASNSLNHMWKSLQCDVFSKVICIYWINANLVRDLYFQLNIWSFIEHKSDSPQLHSNSNILIRGNSKHVGFYKIMVLELLNFFLGRLWYICIYFFFLSFLIKWDLWCCKDSECVKYVLNQIGKAPNPRYDILWTIISVYQMFSALTSPRRDLGSHMVLISLLSYIG